MASTQPLIQWTAKTFPLGIKGAGCVPDRSLHLVPPFAFMTCKGMSFLQIAAFIFVVSVAYCTLYK